MARVFFTKDFTYKPKPNVAIAYRADNEYPNVRREAADQAIAAGAAVERTTSRRRKAKSE